MRYEEPPYFLVGLSILLIGWGLLSYIGITSGSQWIAWGGIVLLIISVSTFYTRRATARTVLGALRSHEGEKIELGTLADELDMSDKELRSAVLDLRAEGRVKVAFDGSTGAMVIGEQKETARARRAAGFCAYCSYPLPPGARFCPSCGSSVEQ
jgi:hypothetical protein